MNQNMNKLLKNPMLQKLLNNLRNAKDEKPTQDTILLGYTKLQIKTLNLKKPRLVWFDAASGNFYDQGDSTAIKKADWYKINKDNYKKTTVMKNLEYYVLIDNNIMQGIENSAK